MINSNERQFIWVEKYRPISIDDVIIPQSLKDTFKKMIEQGDLPNLLLTGPPGTGKTTVARALLEMLGCDYIILNGSLNVDKDALRTDIAGFASTVSFSGGRKYVILDEADYLGWQVQPALRTFMEEFAKNCSFILTCNHKNKVIPALQSRCSNIDFSFKANDRMKLSAQFFKRLCEILENEKIEYDQKVIAEVINKYYPDWRRTLNELQRYAANGKIDSGILALLKNVSLESVIGFMRKNDFTNVRKWVAENSDNDSQSVFRTFYDEANAYFTPQFIPELVTIIARYQYQSSFVVDHEINLSAMLVEIMCSAVWK